MTAQVPKSILVGGHKLVWSVRHWPMWTDEDGLKGMSIEVAPIDVGGRHLLLEFPPPSVHTHHTDPGHARPKVTSREVVAIVERALAGGWSPISRGKPYVFQVEASNNRIERPRER